MITPEDIPLPEITEDFQELLNYNPNLSDIVDGVQAYARDTVFETPRVIGPIIPREVVLDCIKVLKYDEGKNRSITAMVRLVQARLTAALQASCDCCGGRGEVGGFVNAENGYESIPCPGCQSIMTDALDRHYGAKQVRRAPDAAVPVVPTPHDVLRFRF